MLITKVREFFLNLKLEQREKQEAKKLLCIDNKINSYLDHGDIEKAETIFIEYSDKIIDGYLEYSSIIYYEEDDYIDRALRQFNLSRGEMASRLKALLEKFGINYI